MNATAPANSKIKRIREWFAGSLIIYVLWLFAQLLSPLNDGQQFICNNFNYFCPEVSHSSEKSQLQSSGKLTNEVSVKTQAEVNSSVPASSPVLAENKVGPSQYVEASATLPLTNRPEIDEPRLPPVGSSDYISTSPSNSSLESLLNSQPLPMNQEPAPIDFSKPIQVASAASAKFCGPRIYSAENAEGTVSDALTRAGNISCVQAPLAGEMTISMELCGGDRKIVQSIQVERRAHDDSRKRSGVGEFFYSLIDNGIATAPQPMRGGPGGLSTASFPPTYASYVRIIVRMPPLKSYNQRIYQEVCSIVVK